MVIQQRIVKFVICSNWFIFAVATLVGFTSFSTEVGIGVFVGGMIVTLNFHLLARTLKKALTPPHITSIKSVIIKYYIRFAITGILLFFLIVMHLVNPYGLIAGLSVVVLSMMFATINEVRHLLLKEAA